MARARLFFDVLKRGRTYRYGPDRSQRADLHLPSGSGPYPVMVLIHGGSWTARYGRIVMRGLVADLVRHGWAAWNIEYRRLGNGGGWLVNAWRARSDAAQPPPTTSLARASTLAW